ncbi:2,3-bisphosphoglycerate-independent phosphoglycerate mutase [Desulfococcaceae bacterium HSG8]|nr:2,3-bisphosphoglycerate-independent phosphoglycerate mutase [Desulfococcaceae bacterium HSG8]
MRDTPCMLIILDGWGINPSLEGNAVFLSGTPFLNNLMKDYPNTRLQCSGQAVGLPKGIMGNSEVGHLNIGAGRVVYQDLLRIDMAIRDKTFFQNEALDSVMSKIKAGESGLHLMGLLSDGGVHSQLTHLFALLDMAREKGLKRVYVHVILDGRDTPPDSGVDYVRQLQEHMDANQFGTIATICGRFYAMDRDTRWERVEEAFQLYTKGQGFKENDPAEAVRNAYARGETDEFVRPVAILPENEGIVRDGDGIIFFNFRADRVREITRAFTASDFEFFKRDPLPRICEYICMTLYDEKFPLPVAFPPTHLEKILGEVLSEQGLCQLRIAETEKYAHVTYFFNGGEEKPFPLEDRCMIPSPREVQTYDLKPEMSAYQVTDEVISRLQSDKYDLIVLNFANMDMVGHTGIIDAAVSACKAVDECLEKIVSEVRFRGGLLLITSDHGNAEKMIDEKGTPHTAHTTHPVPFILADDSRKDANLRSDGILGDIAPTILHIMGIDKPEEMTGRSLIES